MKSKPVILIIFFLSGVLTSCGNYQNVLHKPQISDGVTYGRLELPEPETEPFRFKIRHENIELPALEEWADKKAIRNYDSVEEFLERSNTTAFIVIRNDSIIFENYYNGYGPNDITQIFSVTKPLTASLLSVALEEDCISSIDEPVLDFMDIEKRRDKKNLLTLRHLGQMQSGFNQSDYRRFLRVIRFYHSRDTDAFIRKVKVARTPGKKFRYKSVDTQVLGICLERAFGEDDLLPRFIDFYWKNIRPENKGYYSIDARESGNLKYYAGVNVSARDLAKIGKIYLNDGRFEDNQVISPEWMEFISDPANRVGKEDYCMGWYFDEWAEGRDVFYGAGFGGQFLLMNKDTNTIIVRLGESKSGHVWFHILSDLSTLF